MMNNWFKSWTGPFLLIIGGILCAIWWILLFTEVKTTKLTIRRLNKPDTTYIVAPRFTKAILEKGDTVFIFCDKDGNAVYKIKNEDVQKYIITPIN